MQVPDYDPPYDSPLEDEFARNFVKYAGAMDEFTKQMPVETIAGRFVLDFAAVVAGEVVAFECDGKDFHNDSRDEWRDAMILGSGHVSTIYRLRGGDLFHRMEDCLFAIANCDPQLFDARGHANLRTLSSLQARNFDFASERNRMSISYPGEGHGRDPLFILVERRSSVNPTGKRQFWQALYSFAVDQGGGRLDDLIALHRKRAATL